MKRRSLRLLLAAGVALFVGGAWLFLGKPPVTSQRLPDGSTVTLLDVSYGRQHALVTGPFWHRFARRVLPEKVARRFGINVMSCATTNETLMVWTELRDLPQLANRTPLASLTVSDGHGTEFCQTVPQIHWIGTNRLIQGTAFPIVPRGSAHLRVVVESRDAANAKQAAVFEVANPAPRRRPAWQASTFPVEAQTGDLKFVLTRLWPFETQIGRSAETDIEAWMRAKCYLTEGGLVTTNWQIAAVEVFDEDGGLSLLFSHFASFDPNEFEFRAGLGADAVWKLRFTLVRVGGFPSNQVATVTRLPRPVADASGSDPIAVDLDGFKLNVSTEFSRNLPGAFGALVAQPSSFDEDFRILALQIVDQDGTNIGWHPFGNRFKGVFFWNLRPTERTEYVKTEYINATLAISRLRHVELLVRPEPPFRHSPSTFPASAK